MVRAPCQHGPQPMPHVTYTARRWTEQLLAIPDMNKRARFTADEAAALRRKFWENATFKVLEHAAHAIRAGALVEEGDREFVALVLEDRANREWRRVNSMSG